MSRTCYVVVAGNAAVGALIAQAGRLGGEVVAIVAGPAMIAQQVARAGVTRVVWFGEPGDRAVEAYAPDVARVVLADPGPVFAGRDPAERVLLGAASGALSAPVVTGVIEIDAEDGDLVVTQAVYGGIAQQTVAYPGPVAFEMDGGPLAEDGDPAPIEQMVATPHPVVAESLDAATTESVDLASAARVVGIGRGLKTQADLGLVNELAAALGAVVGCSRPISEGLDWLSKDRYIGISGATIAPELYLAIGISGQLQHMSGARGSRTVVAINTDAKAPIMAEADYVLVGDLYQLVPAITAALA